MSDMQRTTPPTPLSLWLTLLIGWGPCALGNLIGALTVMMDHPREMLFHVFAFLFYSLAALPLTFLLRSLWKRQMPWRSSAVGLAIATFVLALIVTIAGYAFGLHEGAFQGSFQWGWVFTGMQTMWFLLMTYSAMYLGIGYYLSTQQEGKRALAATALAKEAELRALRYQLHPHFLFNTLNAISTLVVDQHTHEATRMIARLGDFLRATLDGNAAHEVALADELSLTEHYLDIEKVRLGDRLAIARQVGPETLHAAVPYLLLQPLVENAIRHGIAPRRQGGKLEITAARVDDRLHIHVHNDGITHRPEHGSREASKSAVGLRNVQERLRRLYEDDHRLAIEFSEDGHCQVFIDLPYRRVETSMEQAKVA
ncbi:histidine kinase [Dyella sp.]|jgi:two-component system sensor histidine kinase AlgZ|uniref:sensor histidine kinase n=1 Tax=Dyella sp. TaxID=1869338 RepID=UPI002FDAD697